ncbi:cytochrome P450 [Salipaludibacillus neizhouensis]|uniref:Cytochrome P450 n=1 Tax=Salipaludibacillus neizhouensis TaxID=885475 RepID=A0A3A9JXD0_9BACI|nr:cytochrome P450 [Salipaludibacillus neizhouensis]RKL65544.1 cytochrome P450 [Salipaludibacillus neizhouensis]
MESGKITPEQEVIGVLSGRSEKDPFVVFEELRKKGPVTPIPMTMGDSDNQVWIVTQMEEAKKVLKDNANFCVDSNTINKSSDTKQSLTNSSEETSSKLFLSNSLNALDEPDHRRLRRLVSKAFTPRYMESIRPRVQEIADDLLDQVQEQGEMDIVLDFAYKLPINVISDMIGVPKSQHEQIYEWSEAIANGLGLGRLDDEVADSLDSFSEYFKQLIDEKRKQPSNDLISELIVIEEEGDKLSEKELLSMVQLLIFAGHETTSNLISTGTLILLDSPKQLEMLKNDHSLIPNAVEELLRYHGPSTTAGPRYAIKDIELGGQQIKKGDVLFPLLKAANRDEEVFSNSEDLDVTRDINRHLAFGQGIHMCLGAPLARIEGDIAFTTLLKRMPNLKLSIPRKDVQWQFKLAAQGLSSLPVSF